ncbi:microsomal glutathione S-transferase 1-like [Phlebotomus papatasi]|uniref:microsomal glutathione S-transferase 1-like n=1 Tax=Phlebotomus papatasi TaxID=29031 RepID=UPI00248358DE|nr:microsomal glutathione S-transferase 1-like [Phlebotomus papatasi]
MGDVFDYLSPTNPVFRTFAFWSSVLVIKVLFMSIATGLRKHTSKAPKAKNEVNEDVERLRRAHLNDMENIFLFIILGFIYIVTNPSQWLAMMLIKAFAITRILHTLVYAFAPVPQPTRVILFLMGVAVNAYMGLSVIRAFL